MSLFHKDHSFSSTRTADPLAAGIKRFVGPEHIKLDIVCEIVCNLKWILKNDLD